MLRMNRETPIHSSGDESLVIVDNQRRKRLAIIGLVVLLKVWQPATSKNAARGVVATGESTALW